jgi:hypothetical protein
VHIQLIIYPIYLIKIFYFPGNNLKNLIMLKHQSISIIRSLSKKELNKFDLFIKSPYFTKSKRITEFFGVLKNYICKCDKIEDYTKENLWRDLNYKGEYKDFVIRRLFSDILVILKNFLVHEFISVNKYEYDNCLLGQYYFRKLDKLFEEQMKATEKETNNGKMNDIGNLFELSNIKVLKHNYFSKKSGEENRGQIFEIIGLNKEIMTLSIIFFFWNFITSYRNIITVSRNFNITPDYDFEKMYKSINISNIYHKMKEENEYKYLMEISILLFEEFNDMSDFRKYLKLKEAVKKNANKFSEILLQSVYELMINDCIVRKQVDEKHKHFYDKEILNIYKDILPIIKDSPIITVQFFRGIMKYSLILKEYKWLQNFIETHYKKLRREYRDEMYKLSYANLYFNLRKFEEALTYISTIKGFNHFTKMDVKDLELKILYEKGLYENIYYAIENYKKYLKGNKSVTDKRKEIIAKFLIILKKIVSIKIKNEVITSRDDLLNEIKKDKNINEYEWLIEKISELQICKMEKSSFA